VRLYCAEGPLLAAQTANADATATPATGPTRLWPSLQTRVEATEDIQSTDGEGGYWVAGEGDSLGYPLVRRVKNGRQGDEGICVQARGLATSLDGPATRCAPYGSANILARHGQQPIMRDVLTETRRLQDLFVDLPTCGRTAVDLPGCANDR